jgi:hypothetical protein
MPRQLELLLAALIRLVRDAVLQREPLVLAFELRVDAEVGTDVAQFSLGVGGRLHGRVVLQVDSRIRRKTSDTNITHLNWCT